MAFRGIKPKRIEIEEYSRKRLCELIAEIRESGGIPMIRTKYAETPITMNNKKCILVVAYKGGKSRWLCGVPEKDIMEFEIEAGDFKKVLPSCPKEIIERVKASPPPFSKI